MLETDRLTLRPLRLADVDAFLALHADDRVNRFVGSYTRDQALVRLETVEKQWTNRGHGLFAVQLKTTGEFVGRIGPQFWDEFGEVEMAWTLRAEAWGRGYATEAAQACIDWAFEHLAENYLAAYIHPENAASHHVARRLGFSVLRDDILFDKPVIVYSLHRPTPHA
ncbi:GNAT family N-acetyltransferase [Frankia sp. AgB1.9]|uniref:GNAT family N-acetyltransferase n=1 Tax=unclassified Frankia TaxID=2632575 RepID=UPI0019319ED6|nr:MULTISPECIES: GNAT family N-acetyltransferase [unclassified Frankia]MBL7490681.1 GNAT family N-acetyltransferase [Frankia sp. AgW1.1]MBL7547495.1 GNAT family N-acetyltransferase [Frankia sp. AgB1.9]MBL7619006.1 GNAT family N-acetyltransferase [Frankia sp. AgB1.8]